MPKISSGKEVAAKREILERLKQSYGFEMWDYVEREISLKDVELLEYVMNKAWESQ